MLEWSDQLTLAKELAARDDEVAHRTAIYLAYYAVYNSVVEHLLTHGASVEKSNHKATWDLLRYGGGRKPQLLTRGHYLRGLRNRASYERDLPDGIDLKGQANKAITDVDLLFLASSPT